LELQELVSRARLLFSESPKRLQVFELVNGKRSTPEIARKTKRQLSNTLNDIEKMKALELIIPKKDDDGKPVLKDKSALYEKNPLIIFLNPKYYVNYPESQRKLYAQKSSLQVSSKRGRVSRLPIPTDTEILDICRSGEDQTYEFKSHGTDVQKLTKEVAAFANTRLGGIIFYGVADDGTIHGSDVSRQKLDQPLQNSVRNSIAPSMIIGLHAVRVMGYEILVIAVPPWNRKDVFQINGVIYVRKGTNVFSAKPEEVRKLHNGEYVV
jgi:hypothetical protein